MFVENLPDQSGGHEAGIANKDVEGKDPVDLANVIEVFLDIAQENVLEVKPDESRSSQARPLGKEIGNVVAVDLHRTLKWEM
jgi:hypothetical protein